MNISKLQQKFNGHYKLTQQRKIIFRIFAEHSGRHLSAEDISGYCPGIGRSTIYRTLELFNRMAIVQKLDFSDGCQRYELCDHHSHHHHLICVSCGKVKELNVPLPGHFEFVFEHMDDFSVLDYHLYFYGYCKDCQAQIVSKARYCS